MNNIETRKYEIANRKLEIRSLLDSDEKVNLDELEAELRDLDTEMADLEKRSAIVGNLKTIEKPEARKDTITMNENVTVDAVTSTPEYRSAFFKTLQGKALTEAEERAYSSSTAAGAIPTTTSDTLVKKMKAIAPLMDEITLLRAAGNVTFSVEGTNNDPSIAGENVALTDSGDTLVSVSLGGYDITKLIQISKAAATMTVDAFENWITDILSESLTKKLEYFLINGTGSSQPQGVMNTTYVEGTNLLSVSGIPALTDLYKFVGLLPSGYDANAKMLMNKKTMLNDFMQFRDDTVYPAVSELNGQLYVLGYPVIYSDNIATGTVVLGDFSKVVANLNQDITVETQYDAVKRQYNYVASAIFDSKVALSEAFAKLVITAA